MEIPEEPKGWTKKMVYHVNFGLDGGAAEFEVYDETGKRMPFGMAYDTRDGANRTGFVHPDHEGAMTWAELRAFMEGKDG